MPTVTPRGTFRIVPDPVLSLVATPETRFAPIAAGFAFAAVPGMRFNYDPFEVAFVPPPPNEFITSDGETLTSDGEGLTW